MKIPSFNYVLLSHVSQMLMATIKQDYLRCPQQTDRGQDEGTDLINMLALQTTNYILKNE